MYEVYYTEYGNDGQPLGDDVSHTFEDMDDAFSHFALTRYHLEHRKSIGDIESYSLKLACGV